LLLLIAGVLTYPLAFLLLWFYRCAIKARMGRISVPTAAALPDPPLLDNIKSAQQRSAALHALVGCLIAVYLAWLTMAGSVIDGTLAQFVVVTATLAWPAVLSVVLAAGLSRRQRWLMLVGAAAGYTLLFVLLSVGLTGEALANAGVLWLGMNLPVTLFLATFLTRRIRAVGPIVLLINFITVGGIGAVVLLPASAPEITESLGRVLFRTLHPLVVIAASLVIGAGVAVVIGIWLLHKLADLYARNHIGDEGIILSALWLVYIVFLSSFDLLFAGPGYAALGLCAFPLYLLLTRAGRHLFLTPGIEPPPTLLLLRVFAQRGPTADLFHTLSRHWRQVGPITMIGGADLAEAAIEPHEVMLFLRGEISDIFVKDAHSAIERLAASPTECDPDGRYRCRQIFCFDDTWFTLAENLIAKSSVILMDLRLFTTERTGVLKELRAIAAHSAQPKTVILHDNRGLVEATLRHSDIDLATVKLLHLSGKESQDVPILLRCLADVAQKA